MFSTAGGVRAACFDPSGRAGGRGTSGMSALGAGATFGRLSGALATTLGVAGGGETGSCGQGHRTVPGGVGWELPVVFGGSETADSASAGGAGVVCATGS